MQPREALERMIEGIADRGLRTRAKAEAHVAAMERASLSIEIDGKVATFTTPERLPNGLLQTVVTMRGLPASANPFQFANPPIKHGGRVDPEGAFRAILAEAIRGVLAREHK